MTNSLAALSFARQPILDTRQKRYGYALVYRTEAGHAGSMPAPDVIRAINDGGLDAVTTGHPVFLSVDAASARQCVELLGPDTESVVFAFPQSLPDVELATALLERRVRLALGVETLRVNDRLRELASFGVTGPSVGPDDAAFLQELHDSGVRVLATDVHSWDQFTRCKTHGCSLFQGYFFCEPTNTGRKKLASDRLTQVQLLAALNAPNVSMSLVHDLLRRDAALTYRVLLLVNSARYGLKREIASLHEALVMIGLGQIRHICSVLTLDGLNRGPSELVTVALIRARCCELVSQSAPAPGSDASFLLGLFSLLDTLLECPMAEVIDELHLPRPIRAALLGEHNEAYWMVTAVVACENGDWPQADAAMNCLGLSFDDLADAYAQALTWATSVSVA